MTSTTQTVREIALENPGSIRVFEAFGIDYCCGGRRPLAEACATRSIPVEEVIRALENTTDTRGEKPRDWVTQPLGQLAAHIVDVHHAYVRRELPRLEELAAKVVRRHGESRSELPTIQLKLAQLTEELLQHCAKEEMILFPYVTRLERAVNETTSRPDGCFGSVANPIAMMTQEHDVAGALLAEMRELSGGFTPPAGSCPTYHAFYLGLHEFEQDLHQHIHLENNILFPRAIALESSLA
jgi:regulator of cell morphogenesis and NO signaling